MAHVRWYEQNPYLAQAMEQLRLAEPLAQAVIAQVINETYSMEKLTHVPNTFGLKSVGKDKIQGLMRSKNKRRWYDEDPQVHQAVNLIYLMPDEGRLLCALRMLLALQKLKQHAAAAPEDVDVKELKLLAAAAFTVALESINYSVSPSGAPAH